MDLKDINNAMLYDYQKEVLKNSRKDYLYSLDTGTGKTIIALHHYYKYAEGKELIIIAPAAKVEEGGWIREIDSFIEYYNISKFKYQIVSYQSLHKLNLVNIENTFIILDECHYVKNYKSKRSKEILKLTRLALGFIGLSATIASNGWIDTINYFLMFNLYKNPSQFLKQYAKYELMNFGAVKVNQIVGWKDEEYLKTLFDSISSPALKKENCLELPNILYQNIYFKPFKEYRIIKKDRIYEDIIYDTIPKLMAGLRLNGNLEDKINYLKMLRESTKENIVIFYNFKAEYELIKKALKIEYEVRGGINKLPGHEHFKNIKNTVTAVQIQAGGTGIELTHASLVVFFSPTWSYQDYTQALGRAYRNGQDKKVTVYKFIVEKTIDENVYAALENKKDFTERLFSREVEGIKELNRDIENKNNKVGGNNEMSDITDEIIENAGINAQDIRNIFNEIKSEPGENITKNRHKYVGGSDLPGILNISQYKTQFELALEKTKIKPTEFTGNEYTQYGHLMEPLIRDYINSVYNTKFKEDTNINEEHHIRSNCDGIDREQNLLLEVKTNNGKKTDLTEYNVQIQLYLHQFNIDECLLVQYARPENFYKGISYEVHKTAEHFNCEFYPENIKVMKIKKDPNLIEFILKEIDLFWKKCAWLKEHPEAVEDMYYTCLKLGTYDQNVYIRTLTNIEKLEVKIAKIKETEEKLKEEKELLYNIMTAYGFNSIKTEKVNISRVSPSVVNSFDTTEFKKDHPELAKKYVKTSDKKGYIKLSLVKSDATEPKKVNKVKRDTADVSNVNDVKEIESKKDHETIEFTNDMTSWISRAEKKINNLTNEKYSIHRPDLNVIQIKQNTNKDNTIMFKFNKKDMSVVPDNIDLFDKTLPGNFEDFNTIIKSMPAWVTFEEMKSK